MILLKNAFQALLVSFFLCVSCYAQVDAHKWRTLTQTPQLLWVDGVQFDTTKSDPFEIWVLELHKPALTIEGISAKVNRTKTLYAVNRKEHKYGIKKVIYYNNANKEIWRYDYNTAKLHDELKYNFPIPNNSFLQKLFEAMDQKKSPNNYD